MAILLPEGLHWDEKLKTVDKEYLAWGIRRDQTRELVASAKAVTLNIDLSQPLPEDGWEYFVESTATSTLPNCLCLLGVTIDAIVRSFGLAPILIHRAKLAARDRGFRSMIAPVEPSLKNSEPDMALMDYVFQATESGDIYDPWLRLYVQSGGRIENAASETHIWIRWSL